MYNYIPNIDICKYLYMIVTSIEYNNSINYWNQLVNQKHILNKYIYKEIELINSNLIKYINTTINTCNSDLSIIYTIPRQWSFYNNHKFIDISINNNHTFLYNNQIYYINKYYTLCYKKTKNNHKYGYSKVLYKSKNSYNCYDINYKLYSDNTPLRIKINVINIFSKYKLLKKLYNFYKWSNQLNSVHTLFIDDKHNIFVY